MTDVSPEDDDRPIVPTGSRIAVFKELYYLAPDAAMMSASIALSGSALALGAPVRLFSTRVWGEGVEVRQGRQFDVSPDGRFLINTVQASAAEPITLIQNWSPDAKK